MPQLGIFFPQKGISFSLKKAVFPPKKGYFFPPKMGFFPQIPALTGVADGAAFAEAVVVLGAEISILAWRAHGVGRGRAAAPHPFP